MAEPTQSDRRRQAAIVERLSEAGFALPGTLLERTHVCGKANCRCGADPPRPHGPYHQWTRKIDGKTVTRLLTDDQWADYQAWFANSKRLKELVAELEGLCLGEVDADPRWRQK